MYAIKDRSNIYHLMDNATHTLCGLRVTPIVLDAKRDVDVLHKVTEKPGPKWRICKHCEKLKKD